MYYYYKELTKLNVPIFHQQTAKKRRVAHISMECRFPLFTNAMCFPTGRADTVTPTCHWSVQCFNVGNKLSRRSYIKSKCLQVLARPAQLWWWPFTALELRGLESFGSAVIDSFQLPLPFPDYICRVNHGQGVIYWHCWHFRSMLLTPPHTQPPTPRRTHTPPPPPPSPSIHPSNTLN